MKIDDLVKSLAGTDREYLVIGVKPAYKNDEDANTFITDDDYYVTFGSLAAKYLRKLGPSEGSKFRLVQVALYDEPKVHFQVQSGLDGAGNRSYGAAFNVSDQEFYDFLHNRIEDVRANLISSDDDGAWDSTTVIEEWDA